MTDINIADNYEDLCKKVTQKILDFSNKKIALQDRFSMVLSGGATPKGIYQCMAGDPYRNKFNWEKMHLFWGDERWVPPEDPKSNYRMVSETLLARVNIPSGNIHPVQTKKGDLQASARLYEDNISDFFKLKKKDLPMFDLILLGIGLDGHTASLFPGNPALLVKDRLVIAVSQKGITEERITLTLPVINHAGMVFFLVSGSEKAAIVAAVLKNWDTLNYPGFFPANEISPGQGKLCWFLDKAAASRLDH